MNEDLIQPQAIEVPPQVQRTGVQFWAIALVGSVSFAAVGHLLIKFGLLQVAHSAAGHATGSKLVLYITNPVVFTGLSIYGVGTLMWVFAVSRKEISFLYPLTALNYGFIALGGKMLFGEIISPARWIGIAIVVFGVILMQKSGAKELK